MSRSGYCDDYDEEGRLNLWRANVDRTIRGKKGQAFLREMAAALDAMPVKELIAEEIVQDGAACAIGAVALARKLDVSDLDPDDPDEVARVFGVSSMLAREIVYENDECSPMYGKTPEVDGSWKRLPPETPAERWTRMRKWVDDNLVPARGEESRSVDVTK